MSAAVQRLEFAPVQPPGTWRAMALALLAHGLLLAALTWGVNWRHDPKMSTVEAELWAELPVLAAPAPAPQVEPEPVAPPLPEPVVAPPDPQIAIERARVQREQEKETERLAQIERDHRKKLAADKRSDKAAAKRELAQEKALAKQDKANTQALEKQRQENLKRLSGLAGATGNAASTGAAAQSAGPSARYGALVAARIKPNIVFTEGVAGNPSADVEVRTAPDGTIVGRKLVKSSGNKAWDDAVLKAIDKTERLPRDIDGLVPTALVIGFTPRD